MALTKFSKKIVHIASVTTAITIICGALGWIYNEYQDHKSNSEEQLEKNIIRLIKDNESIVIEKIDSLNNRLKNIEGDEMFAVGFRSNGEDLYYRDVSGNLHEVYLDEEYQLYYYMEDGEFIYL